MSRSKQSVEEKILEFFNEGPQASVELVHKLASGILRKRFPAKQRVNKKALNRVAPSQLKKSLVSESAAQE